MFLPFFAPFLVYLDMSLVFYPVAIVLMFLSIVTLPSDLCADFDKVRLRRHENDGRPVFSTLTSILLYAVILYHFGINVGTWKNWLPLLVVYMVIGLLWATWKWLSYCRSVRNAVKESAENFDKTVEDGDHAENVKRSFMTYMFRNSSLRQYISAPYMSDRERTWSREEVIRIYIPQVAEHKTLVLIWIFCWPMSVLKWALADMLSDIYNGVFKAIRGFFQNIAKKQFDNI